MRICVIATIIASIVASSGVLSAAVEERLVPSVQAVTIGEHTVTITTLAVSPERLAKFPSTNAGDHSPTPKTSLTKRVVGNGCEVGCGGNNFCSNDLSLSPDPPLLADCQSLKAALEQLALSEITNTFPCNFPNSPTCPNFTVPPGFEQVYSLGTCAVGLINFNAPGGPDVAFCHYLMAGSLLSLYSTCITNLGFTGSICFSNSNNLGVNWGLEVRHV
ncbi:Hydrophobin [Pleurotus pulmonarius]